MSNRRSLTEAVSDALYDLHRKYPGGFNIGEALAVLAPVFTAHEEARQDGIDWLNEAIEHQRDRAEQAEAVRALAVVQNAGAREQAVREWAKGPIAPLTGQTAYGSAVSARMQVMALLDAAEPAPAKGTKET